MFDELVPAAVYTRVSTDEQVENGYSLAGQTELCRKYAAQYGMTIIQEFVDKGVSGDLPLDARPQGKALLDLIRRKQISAVVIATQDRLSRNLAHTLVIRQQWQSQGIEVHFCDRGKVQNTPEGRLMSNIEATIAEYEREKIRMRTIKGKLDKLRSGKWLGTHTPFGYKRAGKGPDARIMIDEVTAPTVEWIFRAYTTGVDDNGTLSIRGIQRELQAKGIRTVKGNVEWNQATLHQILTNSIYYGVIFFGKQRLKPKEFDTQREYDRLENVPEGEWIRIDLPELEIISEAVFQIAQERKEKNRALSYGQARSKGNYLLSGFMRCGHCGHAIGGQRKPFHKTLKDGLVHDYHSFIYIDPNRKCPNPHHAIKQSALDDVVWNWLKDELSSEERLNAGLDRLASAGQDRVDELSERLVIVRDLIGRADVRISRLVEAYASENDDDLRAAYLAQQRTAAREKKALSSEEAGLVLKLSRATISPDKRKMIIDMAKQFSEKMNRPSTVQQKRKLLDMLSVKIVYYRDEEKYLTVSWAFGSPEKLELEGRDKLCSKSSQMGPASRSRLPSGKPTSSFASTRYRVRSASSKTRSTPPTTRLPTPCWTCASAAIPCRPSWRPPAPASTPCRPRSPSTSPSWLPSMPNRPPALSPPRLLPPHPPRLRRRLP